MSSPLHSGGKAVQWDSRRNISAKSAPGVELVIARVTFGRRLELMKRVRDVSAQIEFFEAGLDEKSRMEASVLSAELDKLFVQWGLEEVRGLTIDGQKATPELLIEAGPEALFREALEAVKAECGLSEVEKKINSSLPLPVFEPGGVVVH